MEARNNSTTMLSSIMLLRLKISLKKRSPNADGEDLYEQNEREGEVVPAENGGYEVEQYGEQAHAQEEPEDPED